MKVSAVALAWLRRIAGLLLFAVVVVWIVRDGTYLAKLNAGAFGASLAVALLTTLLQGASLHTVVRANGKSLSYAQALRVTALGTIGNSAGGLPIGTAVKFGLLHQQAGLSIAQITAGMAIVTAIISVSLLGYATVSVLALEVSAGIKALPGLVLVALLLCAAVAVLVLRRYERLRALAAPYAKGPYRTEVLVFGGLIGTGFVLNCCLVGFLLGNPRTLAELVFTSSAGTVLGLLSMLQSVAGVHELSMALASQVAGVQPIEGVQIALTLRATAIASSVLVLLFQAAAERLRS